jgi:hypothetical protein
MEERAFFSEDWKYLLVLDACRLDSFKKALKEVKLK